MALNRIWRPSPNFNSGGGGRQVVVVHTSEGAQTESSLANFLAQSSSRVSYNTCFDDSTSAGQITECVRRGNRPWSANAANSWGVHGCLCTPSGASAGWSRDVWLSKRTMLAKCAAWIAEECAALGIPIRKIDGAAIRRGERGVCGHGDCTNAGAGGSHFDPGPNFVWAHVIDLASAGGGAGPGPGPEPPPTLEDWQTQVLIGETWLPLTG